MLSAASRSPLAHQAADQIREAIRDGRYPPGTALVERQLALELGTSHIPIREALARLVDEGIVERPPHHSARVAELDDRQLDEITSLRTTLEQFVVMRAQQRLTARDVTELGELVARMEAAAERGDVQQVLTHDRLFHRRLWELADHQLVLELADRLRGRIDGFLAAVLSSLDQDGLLRQARTHRALLAAVTDGDPQAAADAVAQHIAAAASQLRERPAHIASR